MRPARARGLGSVEDLVDVVQAVAAWLHSMATVVLLGYYVLVALVVVPVLRRTVDAPTLGRVIPAIERRALPLILGAIGIFLVTGTYLLLTDDRFLGVGHFFGSTWSTLIVIKHVLVVVLIVIGVYVDVLVVPDIATPVDEVAQTAAVHRLARGASAIAILGAIVLLLTAAAQAS
jgi:uncharacterized membrane protein